MLTTPMTPKLYIAWNKLTGLYLETNGYGFYQPDRNRAARLTETELLLVRHQWQNVSWERIDE